MDRPIKRNLFLMMEKDSLELNLKFEKKIVQTTLYLLQAGQNDLYYLIAFITQINVTRPRIIRSNRFLLKGR